MPVSIERVKDSMDLITSTNPVLHLATVSVFDRTPRPHSSSVWFAPSDDLTRLYWLSATTRTHSQHIDSFSSVGRQLAPVSGSMNLLSDPSTAVVGLSFEGKAHKLISPADREYAFGRLLVMSAFKPEELEGYITPPTDSEMPAHEVYVAEVSSWTHFNGLESPENRKTVIQV
ncbi:MAG TPA: hypothetical protein VIH90_07790 [Candidatus Saccharimonadales bacterium]